MSIKSIYTLFIFLFLLNSQLFAQTILSADGPGNTYELITSVLAPGANPVEAPDCSHPGFGRHIEEVWDNDLGKNVFVFHIHVSPDDDRCINFDRQRNEIKTYDQSPSNLKGVEGETVIYKWKFKLGAGFEPSANFTHLHQIKAVGGPEADMPQFTLTARAGSPQWLQLRYVETNSVVTLTQVPLNNFKDTWVEVVETITYGDYGDLGSYEISANRVSDGTLLLYHQNNSIRTWMTGAEFMRPKWGIYRSLNDPTVLNDEQVRFADFCIEEVVEPSNFVEEDCTLDIPLEAGWNLISSRCIPDNLDMEAIFANIESNVIQVKNLQDTYVPAFGFNGLGDWDITSGYQVKMIQPDILTIIGKTLDPSATPISLQTGWNLSAYFLEGNGNPFTVFGDLNPNVIQVKDLTGNYIPSFNFSDLGALEPFQGFQIKMSQPGLLYYDPADSFP